MDNKKILVFSPHADDVELSMGGTIAKLSKTNDVTIITSSDQYEEIIDEFNQSIRLQKSCTCY